MFVTDLSSLLNSLVKSHPAVGEYLARIPGIS